MDGLRLGFPAFRSPPKRSSCPFVKVVSKKEALQEAANLFVAMHHLDAPGLDLILAELVSRIGLGLALMDRVENSLHPIGWKWRII
jgi:hypothetical protein